MLHGCIAMSMSIPTSRHALKNGAVLQRCCSSPLWSMIRTINRDMAQSSFNFRASTTADQTLSMSRPESMPDNCDAMADCNAGLCPRHNVLDPHTRVGALGEPQDTRRTDVDMLGVAMHLLFLAPTAITALACKSSRLLQCVMGSAAAVAANTGMCCNHRQHARTACCFYFFH